MPSKKLAGLLAAAIVTDTIVFKSPTSTPVDRAMAERMAKIAGLSLDTLGREIFSVSPTDGSSLEELYFTDFKQFQIAGHSPRYFSDYLAGYRRVGEEEAGVPCPDGARDGAA